MMTIKYIAAATITVILAAALSSTNAARSCNGSPDYCDLPFDRFTFMGTHNSVAYNLRSLCITQKHCVGLPHTNKCLYNNQRDHDIAQQLRDGVRAFDIDTCVYKNDRAISCHGAGKGRAIGPDLDLHMQQVRDFIDRNPNEVVVLEYGDYDGNPEITGRTTIFRLNKYLAGRMLERPDPNAPWPTLGQMIDHRKQVVVFSGRYRDSTKNVPNWFIDRRPYIEGSWSYTRYGTSTKDLMNDFTRHASNTPADTRLWQCIDYGYDVSVGNVILSSIGLAHKCLEDVANDSYPRLKDVAKLYSDKFVHVHRIRVDFYYKYLNDFRNLVQSVNAKNVQRYRASINYQ